MIIDIHNHPDWLHYNFDKHLADMDACGIGKTWIQPLEAPKDETAPHFAGVAPTCQEGGPIPFSYALAYVEKAPERFVLAYAPDPRRPEAIDLMASYIGLYNVKVCGEVKLRVQYDDPDMVRFFRFCGEKGLPVVLHYDYEFPYVSAYPRPNYWYGGDMDSLERLLRKCPETNFLGHAPGFWANISGDGQHDKEVYPEGAVAPGGRIVELLDKYPNLYCDCSGGSGLNGLSRDAAFAREFLTAYQDRVCYGRDGFGMDLQDFVNSLGLEQVVLNKFYYQNALKLTHEA